MTTSRLVRIVGRRPPAAALLLAALALLVAGCAPKRVLRQPADPVVPTADAPGPTPAPDAAGPDTPGSQRAIQAAGIAHAQIGRPYLWGGEDPGTGFDCSGLVFYSYRAVGVEVPRVVGDQVRAGRRVDASRLLVGDLVFFSTDGGGPDHVGIYLGQRRFVHAPRTGKPVRLDSLDDPWWRRRWTGSRRVSGAW